MPERILFLDIDGVMSGTSLEMNWAYDSRTGREIVGKWGICRIPVENLNRIIETTQAQIVLSSMWRLGGGLENTRVNMVRHGFRYPETIIAGTPDLRVPCGDHRGPREDEISKWLTDAGKWDSSFAILEDEHDLGILKDHCVYTDPALGLTTEDADHVIAILQQPPETIDAYGGWA